MNRLFRWMGVSASDAQTAGARQGCVSYLITVALRSFLRLLANHCPLPSCRVWLFRCSGIEIGAGSTLNMNTIFLDDFTPGLVVIGRRVSMAPGVTLVASSHPNNSRLGFEFGLGKTAPVRVEDDAWLGANCIVLPGVTVGACSLVGAGAVVTKDVPPFAIVAGVPARPVGDVREGGDRRVASDQQERQ